MKYSNLRLRLVRRRVTAKPVVEPAIERFFANLLILYDGQLPPMIEPLVHDLVEHFDFEIPRPCSLILRPTIPIS